MTGWFIFWVVVCSVAALVLLGFAIGMVVDMFTDAPIIATLMAIVALAAVFLVAAVPWIVRADDAWQHRCSDAGGAVVVTGHHWQYVYTGKVTVPMRVEEHGCMRDGELISV